MAAFNRFRLFHWLLAGFFLGAYLSGDDAETLHIWLDNALLLPHEQIAERIASLVPDKQTPIVVYCRSGRRSSIAEDQLRQLGYRHVRNAGGYEQFRKTLADNPSTCSQC